jgi:DNA repair photolyase
MIPQTENPRATMNGKPVFEVPAKGVINLDSGFRHKLLCDGPTFSAGTACVYRCAFCYVPSMMQKQGPYLKEKGITGEHEDIVIRRNGAVEAMRNQLLTKGKPRYAHPEDNRVIYASPLVDVAGNLELCHETADLCALILALTNWQIRLLSKSNLLPKIAKELDLLYDVHGAKERVIYGVSTGTCDDNLAKSFEQGTPLVSKRLQSLHWLQDNGYRTFGMICPSLPQKDYPSFAKESFEAIRGEKCEHVWAEVINVRGESMTRTVDGLNAGGFKWEAQELARVSKNKEAWEAYSRRTFEAHAPLYPPGKLRFLQYVNNGNRDYWTAKVGQGAILL